MAAGRTVVRSRDNRRIILLVLIVVAVLTVLAVVEGYRLYQKRQEYIVVEQELEEKLDQEKKRTRDLEAYQKFVGTDEFIEWYAKERLGLVHENDIIFRRE